MNILYLCDRRACETCSIECYYTKDVTHAKSFENVNGTLMEKNNHRFTPMITIDPLPSTPLIGLPQKTIFEYFISDCKKVLLNFKKIIKKENENE